MIEKILDIVKRKSIAFLIFLATGGVRQNIKRSIFYLVMEATNSKEWFGYLIEWQLRVFVAQAYLFGVARVIQLNKKCRHWGKCECALVPSKGPWGASQKWCHDPFQ